MFGLGAGLGFAFSSCREEPPIYLVGRTRGLERDICDHLEIALDLRQTDDPDEGWAVLRDELDAGHPTMVWADIPHLEYLRVKLHEHDARHRGHRLRRGRGRGVHRRQRPRRDPALLAPVARAGARVQGLPRPQPPRRLADGFPAPLPAAGRPSWGAAAGAVANMRGGGEGADRRARGWAWPASALRAGLPALAGALRRPADGALRGLRVFIVKAGTGGALFRSLHADFLADAGSLLRTAS